MIYRRHSSAGFRYSRVVELVPKGGERERERESEEETLTRVEPNGADTLDLPHERGQADVPHRPRPLVLRGDGSA
jgi:hypothetical protein